MGGAFVFQFQDEDKHQYLSIYKMSGFGIQFCDSYALPIYLKKGESHRVYGNSCEGFYFFKNPYNDFVVCNLSTLESKPLIVSDLVEPPPHLAIFHACGIGKDYTSGLFKVVLTYSQDFYGEDDEYLGYDTRALIYSIATDSFEMIGCPFNFLANTDTVYVGYYDKRFWTAAMMGISKHPQFPPPFVQFHVVSFDFRTEEFAYFSLPPYLNEEYKFNLLEYGVKLGAIGHCESSPCQYDVWVCEEQEQWTRLHCLNFGLQVERVLAINFERLVFLEVPCEDDNRRSDVHVYDLATDKMMGTFNIRGKRGNLDVFPFVDNECELLNGVPMFSSYAEAEAYAKVKSRGEDMEAMEAAKKKKKKNKKKNKKKK